MTEYKRSNGETVLLSSMSAPHLTRVLASLRRDLINDRAHLIPLIEAELQKRNSND